MHTGFLVDRLRRAGGIARSNELIAAGATHENLRSAVGSGDIARVREGVYCLPGCDAEVLAAARHGGELCCVSVLRRLGVWILDDENRLHVWLGQSGRRVRHPDCECVSHYGRGRAGFGAVGVARALVQTARCKGADCFFAAFESAWRKGFLSRADRLMVRAGLPAGMRWLVDIARPNADSGLESLLRLRLHRLGVTMRSQVRIRGVGVVDFLVDGILILEVDGRENHDGESMRHKDLRRDAAAAGAGYETLRFDYALVVHDWPVVERAILTRCAAVRAARDQRRARR